MRLLLASLLFLALCGRLSAQDIDIIQTPYGAFHSIHTQYYEDGQIYRINLKEHQNMRIGSQQFNVSFIEFFEDGQISEIIDRTIGKKTFCQQELGLVGDTRIQFYEGGSIFALIFARMGRWQPGTLRFQDQDHEIRSVRFDTDGTLREIRLAKTETLFTPLGTLPVAYATEWIGDDLEMVPSLQFYEDGSWFYFKIDGETEVNTSLGDLSVSQAIVLYPDDSIRSLHLSGPISLGTSLGSWKINRIGFYQNSAVQWVFLAEPRIVKIGCLPVMIQGEVAFSPEGEADLEALGQSARFAP
jgi:hypothetical protein